MAQGPDQGQADRAGSTGVSERAAGSRLQFLPIHRGQHRRRNLRRQRRELGQDRRSKPGRVDETGREGPRPDAPGSRRYRSRYLPGPRPAKLEHQSGSGKGRALRPQFRRCEFGRSSCHGWGCSDLRPGGRAAVRSVVRYTPEYRNNIDEIRNVRVGYTTASGANAYIPLSELATISLDTGAAWIYHESVQRFIPVKFSVRDRDLGGTVEEAQQRIAKNVKLPSGYHLIWAGEFGDLQDAKKRLEIIVPLSFILIAGALYSLFKNFRDSILALAGIPDAIVGGILALYVTGLNFSISAAIGFVSLFGVSVMDGILMITFYNQERSRGLAPVDAMYRAATTRMRPLLMTALSACIGLLPAAISTGIGSQVQRPLATVIVGGMLVGPVMLLIVVPALRMIFLGRENGTTPEVDAK